MNTIAIVMAFAGAGCFALAAPCAARRLPPHQATWVISVGAVASALSTTVVLGLLAVVLVGQLPVIANLGRWSSSALHDHAFTEPGVGAAALMAVVAAALAVIVAGRREVTALISAYRACRSMPAAVGDLVVLPGGPSDAVAVPGRPGRIVMGESLLAELNADERRALLAHEHAHLDHGHHWHRGAVLVAAAANPMLAPLRAVIVHATERWADEQAASEVGDRRRVAAALIGRRCSRGPDRGARGSHSRRRECRTVSPRCSPAPPLPGPCLRARSSPHRCWPWRPRRSSGSTQSTSSSSRASSTG